MYPDLKKFLSRDYFGRPDSSLSCSFSPQGLFRPARFISILLFSPQGLFRPAGFISILLFFFTGIISASRIHLYLALFLHRDYFASVRCISILLFCSTEIISTARIHPYLAFLFHRDYFNHPDSSLSGSFAPQGLFRPGQIRPPSLKTSLPGHSVNSSLSY